MNEIIEQDDRYPEWLKAWNAKAAEIDQQIINFFSGHKEYNAGSLDDATTHVMGWWDSQALDPIARREYENAKRDNDIRSRVQNRIERLEEKGKFPWNNKTNQAAT